MRGKINGFPGCLSPQRLLEAPFGRNRVGQMDGRTLEIMQSES
jgi:hypothetical protein